MRNFIVIRHSPDWLRFDLDQSRQFCRSAGLPENTVLEFAAAWDGCMSVPYRSFRHRLKQIAIENFKAVNGATVIDQQHLEKAMPSDDCIVAFVDDDDWFSPFVFETLRETAQADGYVWASLRLGHDFSVQAIEKQVGPLLYRARDKFIYTNNYAVSGRVLRHSEVEDYLEHGAAHASMMSGRFNPAFRPAYLSCTNKHPASTVAARTFVASEDFRHNPRRELARAFDQVMVVELSDPDLHWLNKPVAHYLELLEAALK
jgi:hypothetical protein